MRLPELSRLRTTAESQVGAILLGFLFLLSIFLSLRSLGLYPSLPDEAIYAAATAGRPFVELQVPSYLYYFVFSTTRTCGEGFFDCARVLNSVLFAAGIVFVFLTARRYCSPLLSLYISFVVGLSPLGSYTAYFMPEVMYFLMFSLFAWHVLQPDKKEMPRGSYGAVAGLILGLAALVKAHALFLVPGFALFLLYRCVRARGVSGFRPFAIEAFAFTLCLIVARVAVGYLLAGKEGLSLLGGTYSSIGKSALELDNATALIAPAGRVFVAHVTGLIAVLALPIVALFTVPKEPGGFATEASVGDLRVFSLVTLVTLLVVVSLFTAKVSGSSIHETGDRIHARYYSFLFPLLVISAVAQLRVSNSWRPSRFLGLSVATAVALVLWLLVPPLTSRAKWIDSPDLYGLLRNPFLYSGTAILSAVAVWTWVLRPNLAVRLFLFVCLPLTALIGTHYVRIAVNERVAPDMYDSAGEVAARYYAPGERIVFVGTDRATLYRSLISLNRPGATIRVAGAGATVPVSPLLEEFDGVILVGNVLQEEKRLQGCTRVAAGGAMLIRRVCAAANFRAGGEWDGIKQVVGIASREPWGAWSTESKVVIRFTAPLPERFRLELRARAFGPNEGVPIPITVAGNTKSVPALKWDLQTVTLNFHNEGAADEIVISIPRPTSPKQLGISEDPRALGVGIESLRIMSAQGAGSAGR